MELLKPVLGALGYVAGTYMNDAVKRPRSVAKHARAYCNKVRKPLLCIRAPRVVDKVFGEPVDCADVIISRAYPIPVPDKAFGAVVVVNVLEGLKRPDLAISEWRRIADRVFVVVPSWFSPMTWLDPGHRWLVDPNLKRVLPLWTGRRKAYLLPVSDSRYGTRPWSQTAQQPNRPGNPPPSPPAPEPAPSGESKPTHLMQVQGSESPPPQQSIYSEEGLPGTDGPLKLPSGAVTGESMVTDTYDEEGSVWEDES